MEYLVIGLLVVVIVLLIVLLVRKKLTIRQILSAFKSIGFLALKLILQESIFIILVGKQVNIFFAIKFQKLYSVHFQYLCQKMILIFLLL